MDVQELTQWLEECSFSLKTRSMVRGWPFLRWRTPHQQPGWAQVWWRAPCLLLSSIQERRTRKCHLNTSREERIFTPLEWLLFCPVVTKSNVPYWGSIRQTNKMWWIILHKWLYSAPLYSDTHKSRLICELRIKISTSIVQTKVKFNKKFVIFKNI